MEAGSAIVFAIICAIVAHARGRFVIGWFILGLLLQCFALLLLIILPDLNAEEEEREKRRRMRGEVRKLREQLTQERLRNEERFAETSMRLDTHDNVQGIDTRPPPPLPEAGPVAALAGREHPYVKVEWFWAEPDAETYHGPIPIDRLAEFWHAGDIGHRTLVWSEQLPDWTEIDQVIGLRELLDA